MKRIWIRMLLILGVLFVIGSTLPQGQALYESIIFRTTGKLVFSATAPTIGTGWGTGPALLSSNGATTFRVNVGTGGSATQGTVLMPASTTGWNCTIIDMTTNVVTRQATTPVASVASTAVVAVGASGWAASDTLLFNCAAF